MQEKFLSAIFPVGGGSIFGSVKGMALATITAGGILQVVIYAAIGAVVGWLIKLGLDYLKKKLSKQNKLK